MKKKMKNIKKKKTKIKKDKLTFPKQLMREDYFKCPIWFAKEDKFVNELKSKNPKELSDLMNISSKIADLNYERNHSWSLPFTQTMQDRQFMPLVVMFTED